MERITEKMLQRKVDYLNKLTNNPLEPYAKDDTGHYRAQLGCYTLSGAYGGWSLEQITTDGGGVHSIFNCGHIPKRELFNRICAYIDGIETAKAS